MGYVHHVALNRIKDGIHSAFPKCILILISLHVLATASINSALFIEHGFLLYDLVGYLRAIYLLGQMVSSLLDLFTDCHALIDC